MTKDELLELVREEGSEMTLRNAEPADVEAAVDRARCISNRKKLAEKYTKSRFCVFFRAFFRKKDTLAYFTTPSARQIMLTTISAINRHAGM